MPSPPTLHKVNPVRSPDLLRSDRVGSMPLSQVDQYAENLLARRLSTLNGVAQVNVFGAAEIRGAHPGRSRPRFRHATSASTRSPQAVQAANVDANTGQLNGPKPGHPDPCQWPDVRRRALQQADHRLPQRRAGAHQGHRPRHRQRTRTSTRRAGSTASARSS